jgi:selenocysteine lyase/cysteine desulfurase
MDPKILARSFVLFDLTDSGLKEKVLAAQRGNAVRLSPHFYNDESDIERFFDALDNY